MCLFRVSKDILKFCLINVLIAIGCRSFNELMFIELMKKQILKHFHTNWFLKFIYK